MENIVQFAERLGYSLYDYQQELLLSLLSNKKNVVLSSRQMGISTLLNILITYKLVHRELIDRPYNISFVTFKFMNAYEIMSKIKNFLDKLTKEEKSRMNCFYKESLAINMFLYFNNHNVAIWMSDIKEYLSLKDKQEIIIL